MISTVLAEYRGRTYTELIGLIGRQDVSYLDGPDGQSYIVEVEAAWDDRPGGALRVLGTIDDGGFRAFLPLCDDFLVSPNSPQAEPERGG